MFYIQREELFSAMKVNSLQLWTGLISYPKHNAVGGKIRATYSMIPSLKDLKISNTNYSFFRATGISVNNYKANQGAD